MKFIFSGEGSAHSGESGDTRASGAARAVTVHPEAQGVMYFA